MAGAVRTTPVAACAAVDRVSARSESLCRNVHKRHQLWVRFIRIKNSYAVVEEALAKGGGRKKAEALRNRRGPNRVRFAIGQSDAATSAKATECVNRRQRMTPPTVV